ncbi:DUF6415 family natural product biosynthesis protein [Streptomyces luteireticuli]|uniref:DUF6415 family natural product biosynthesis protein n=1 Tax=Streptomyces luteireticuli TaxID=173858 RepID=UPI0035574B05
MTRHAADAGRELPVVAPMMTGDTLPIDLVTIRATADRALQECVSVPRRAEVRELTSALHGQLALLAEEVRHRHEEAGGIARRRWAAVLNRAEMDLARSRAPGQLPVQYMQEIARTCRHLVDLLVQ